MVTSVLYLPNWWQSLADLSTVQQPVMRIVPVLLFLSTCLQMQPKATNGFSPYQLRNIKRSPGSGFTSGNMPETQLSNMPSHESGGNIIHQTSFD